MTAPSGMTAANGQDPYRVEASADKRLFVSMLIKDIELLPAIIDLVDNSIDGARATSPSDMSQHHVQLQVEPGRFAITDDCGGISLDVARKYAFRFGRPSDYSGLPGSVGQFGIGMKRALFKLGREFTVTSRTASSFFVLHVDVDEWLVDPDPDWHFRMQTVNTDYDPATGGGVGTEIIVTKLHENVSQDFSNPTILAQLREQIRMRHQAALQEGLEIKLGGERLTGFAPTLLSGPGFSPINERFVIPEGDGEVHCHLVAGISAAENENLDEGQAEDFRAPGDAGWWLFCNGRLLLFRERTSLTGWGENGAAYHPQYRRFRGYAYLTSLDTELLPWNTTKTNVDQDSQIWRIVQGRMKIALGQVQSVLNRLKSERQHAEDREEMPVTVAAQNARPVPIADLPPSPSVVSPSPPPKRASRPPKTTQRIQYDVPYLRYVTVANTMGISVISEVGRRTFDYFYENEVES
jgi:Histidine kinase-, DNA gyrase B-, and HSP90-like ATPase